MRLTRAAVLGALFVAASCATFNASPVLTAEDFRSYPTVGFQTALRGLNWRPNLAADIARWCDRTGPPDVHVIDGIPVASPEVQQGDVPKVRILAENRRFVRELVWGEDIGRIAFLSPDDADAKYPELCPCACGLVELQTRP